MLEKNYIINQFEETLSPKFLRQQKYLRKTEHKFFENKKHKKSKLSRSVNSIWKSDYFKRSQGLKQQKMY